MVIIKHRGNYTLVALFGVFFSILLGLIVLLWYEYRFFCQQTKEVVALQSEYRAYIHSIKMYDHKFDMAESEKEESTVECIKSQEPDLLLTQIDTKERQDCNDQVLTQETDPCQEVIKTQAQSQELHKENKITNTENRDCKLDFIWPIQQSRFWLSSLFGSPRKRRNGSCGSHSGIDMAALKGTPIKAAQSGKVIEARYASGYGNTVVLKHNETYTTRYAHLYTFRVHVGQKIKQGMVIGAVGDTGSIRKKGKDGSHLHFEVCENGKKINPLHCLPAMS